MMLTCELCGSPEVVQGLVADDAGYPFGVLALCPADRLPHRYDEQCGPFLRVVPLNEPNEECSWCGVWHIYPCDDCGARAFHREGCRAVRDAMEATS